MPCRPGPEHRSLPEAVDPSPLGTLTNGGGDEQTGSDVHQQHNHRRECYGSTLESSVPMSPPPPASPSRSTTTMSSEWSGDRSVGTNNSSRHRRPRSILIKTRSGSFYGDARAFAHGSLPHSMVLALIIGIVCGTAAYLYYTCLEWALEFFWKTLPAYVFNTAREGVGTDTELDHWYYVLWIPLVGFGMALLLGLAVRCLGDPGDLSSTIECVHTKAYVSIDHVVPMVVASQFSILGGGSLGPEAPLVAICAALAGFVSRAVFKTTSRNLIRKHTLMGMAGALSAFFGAPLGGSIFALEIHSRFGLEYFEHVVESILCGEVCLAVFRGLSQLPIRPIWKIVDIPLVGSSSIDIVYGMFLGLFGASIAWTFAKFHKAIMSIFRNWGYLNGTNRAISRAMLGSIVVVLTGMLVPQSMFWGEYEFQTLATLGPASSLPHIWPTSGLLHFEMDSTVTCLIVGVVKLVAISFTVAGGYRGGYIFPAFAAAAAFGRAIYFLCPFVPPQLCVLCVAAAVNVALTRTAVATTLILVFLSGEQNAMPSVLAASLISLFATGYMSFIPTQDTRRDLDDAIFHPYYATDDTNNDTVNPNDGHGYGEETSSLLKLKDGDSLELESQTSSTYVGDDNSSNTRDGGDDDACVQAQTSDRKHHRNVSWAASEA